MINGSLKKFTLMRAVSGIEIYPGGQPTQNGKDSGHSRYVEANAISKFDAIMRSDANKNGNLLLPVLRRHHPVQHSEPRR